jgi:signal transduction histidine kinase
MDSPTIIHVRDPRLLHLATYLALVVMTVIGLLGLSSTAARAITIALAVVFGLVYAFGFHAAQSKRQMTRYFAIQTILVSAILALRPAAVDTFGFLFFMLSVQAFLVFLDRDAMRWLLLFFLLSSLTAFWGRGASGLVYIVFSAAAYVLLGVFGSALRQTEIARRQNEHLLAELRVAQRRLQDLAVAEERNRLARDLHDSAKQQAFALSAQLDAAHSLIHRDPAAAERHLRQAEQLADTLRQELATFILELRPPALDNAGLATALHQYAAEWAQQSTINATVHVRGERVLPREVEHTLFRIAQEALANIARHSRAHAAEVRLDYTPEQVTLAIQDDGQGFDPQQISRGVGLHSMRERAALLPQGTLALDTGHGRGTRVTVQCQV